MPKLEQLGKNTSHFHLFGNFKSPCSRESTVLAQVYDKFNLHINFFILQSAQKSNETI